jgi:hypothetical protein
MKAIVLYSYQHGVGVMFTMFFECLGDSLLDSPKPRRNKAPSALSPFAPVIPVLLRVTAGITGGSWVFRYM